MTVTTQSPTCVFPHPESRVTRLLGCLSSGEFGPDDASGISKLSTTLERSDSWGVQPLVRAWLLAQQRELPDAWTDANRKHRVRLAILRRKLVAILDALEHVPVVVLKGEPLGFELFGDATLRPTTDIDILVAPDDVEQVLDIVRGLGFGQRPHVPMKPWAYNQVELFHDSGVLLEVHWRIALPRLPAPATADVLARRRLLAVWPGDAVPVLSLHDLLIGLAIHFHQHRGALKTLLDMAAFLDRYASVIDWNAVGVTLRRLGIAGIVDWARLSVTRLLGQPDVWIGRHQPSVELLIGHTMRTTTEALITRSTERLELVKPLHGPVDQAREVAWQTLSMFALDQPGAGLRAAVATAVLGPHRLGMRLAPLFGGARHPSD